MAISVVVREYTGERVATYEIHPHPLHTDFVRVLVDAASLECERFPLLAGVDQYDDTSFNEKQCTRLVDELAELRRRLDDDDAAAAAAAEIEGLARMVIVDGPRQPHHRRLHFIGD